MSLSVASSALKRCWQALLRCRQIVEGWGDAFKRSGKVRTTLDDLITDVILRPLRGSPAPVSTVGSAGAAPNADTRAAHVRTGAGPRT